MLKRKYQTLLIISMLITIITLQFVSAKTLPLIGVTITIDPGHGGRDSGTLYGNILEKNINLSISKKLETQLGKNGAIVYMTRTSDVDLSSVYDSRKKRGDLYRRLKLIKENKSDLYLSIHINWYNNSKYKGAEVLYNPINENNKQLARSIMEQFEKDLNSKREIKKTNLYLYSNITTPGVLIECGYLSNSSERSNLVDEEYQEKISKAITKGVINYLKVLNKDKFVL